MYLTRTKLLAAGLVLAGILTTSAGVLSRADAQGGRPADPAAEELKRYYDALRGAQTPKEKWEYRFLPVDKPLSTTELRIVLLRADGEGWTYCGSQDLAADTSGKVAQHMVFKRPTGGGAADATPPARNAAANDLLDQAKLRAEVEAQVRREERLKRLAADDQAVAERAARDAAARQLETEAKVRAELERANRELARAQQADAAKALADAEKVLREREGDRRKELDALKAQYEALINKLQAELKAKEARPPAKGANPANKKPEPQAGGNPFGAGASREESLSVQLKHVRARDAAEALGKLMPTLTVASEPVTNSLMVSAPGATLTEARTLIEKLIDVPAGKAREPEPAFVMFRLKHVTADEVAKVLEKATGGKGAKFVPVQSTNTLLASGTPGELADVRKLVIALDVADGPAK